MSRSRRTNVDKRGLLGGIVWFLFSIFVLWESIRLGVGTLRIPEPGFLPFWLGVCLAMLSLIVVAVSILKGEAGKEIENLWEGVKWSRFIFALISLLLYTIFLTRLGYIVATFGLMSILFGLIGRRRIWIQMAGALLTTLISYVIFYIWLDIQLPKGILFFV